MRHCAKTDGIMIILSKVFSSSIYIIKADAIFLI